MGRLTLIRHGQSIWNLQNRFTGWIDVSLSEQGVKEAQQAAALLADQHFDRAFTSSLLRAQDTLYEILKQNRHCNHYLRIHETGREWYEHFKPTGEHVLISAHGNSLRAIIMQLEHLSAEQILAYELKTGAPHIYELDEQMQIMEKHILN